MLVGRGEDGGDKDGMLSMMGEGGRLMPMGIGDVVFDGYYARQQ